MSTAVYQPWLFDDYNAWVKTVSDPRWSYDLPISRMMGIYAEYRSDASGASPRQHTPAPIPMAAPAFSSVLASQPVQAAPAPAATSSSGSSSGQAGQILSQNEIDNLLSMLSK